MKINQVKHRQVYLKVTSGLFKCSRAVCLPLIIIIIIIIIIILFCHRATPALLPQTSTTPPPPLLAPCPLFSISQNDAAGGIRLRSGGEVIL